MLAAYLGEDGWTRMFLDHTFLDKTKEQCEIAKNEYAKNYNKSLTYIAYPRAIVPALRRTKALLRVLFTNAYPTGLQLSRTTPRDPRQQ